MYIYSQACLPHDRRYEKIVDTIIRHPPETIVHMQTIELKINPLGKTSSFSLRVSASSDATIENQLARKFPWRYLDQTV